MIQEESLQSQQTLRTINEYLMDMYKQGKLKRRTMETKDIKLPDKYQTPDWLFEKQEQPSLPSDLDEAAHNFEDNALSDYDDIVVTEDGEERPVLKYNFTDAFKAGAEWMAGQGVKIGETKIYLEDDGDEPPYSQEWLDLESTEFKLPDGAFQPGDEVEIILRKKQ